MVTLGMGATLAGIITTIPSITLISNYKEYVFIVSGILIFFLVFLFNYEQITFRVRQTL